MSATVLLTGAAGSIGTALRERLPALGWELRSLDRTAVPGGVVGDITDPADAGRGAGGDPRPTRSCTSPASRPRRRGR